MFLTSCGKFLSTVSPPRAMQWNRPTEEDVTSQGARGVESVHKPRKRCLCYLVILLVFYFGSFHFFFLTTGISVFSVILYYDYFAVVIHPTPLCLGKTRVYLQNLLRRQVQGYQV